MKPREDADLVKKVKARIDGWYSYWKDNNEHYRSMVKFVMGEQWDHEEQELLTARNKTPLAMNKLPALMNNILGEQRQNTPNLQVIAVTDNVTDEDINLRQQLVKTIAYKSESKVAYQSAFQCALVGGYGVIRVTNDYESEESFKQCIKIEAIQDPTKCFFDPNAKSHSKADGAFCGMRYSMSKDKFQKKYPKLDIPSDETLKGSGVVWVNDDSLCIVDYLERAEEPITLYKLEDGSTISKDDYMKRFADNEALGLELPQVIDQRDSYKVVIKRYKIAGNYILEETEFPAKGFAYVFVDQNSYVDPDSGKQITQSFFKNAKDPQRLLNYVVTQIAYLMKTQRSDQWLAPPQCTDNYPEWTDPEVKKGALPYDPYIIEYAGQAIGVEKPTRITPDVISPELFQQYDRSLMDIYTCVGVYETQTGQQGNEISGAAIDARTQRGNVNTYVTFDSLNRGIAQVGNVVSQMFPRLYPDELTMFIDDEEKGRVPVKVNERGFYDGAGVVKNDLSKGDYVIVIEPSGTFEGQKQQALQALRELIQVNPASFNYICDQIAKNLSLPNANKIAERLQLMLAPQVQQMEGIQVPPSPPNPMAMVEQMKMQNEAGKQKLDAFKIESNMQLAQQKHLNEQQEGQMQLKLETMRAMAEIINASLGTNNPAGPQIAAVALNILQRYT